MEFITCRNRKKKEIDPINIGTDLPLWATIPEKILSVRGI